MAEIYQAVTFALVTLCTLTGASLLVIGTVLSWRSYRRQRAEGPDPEHGVTTQGDSADIHNDDTWIFGSVASRSNSHCPRRGSYVGLMSESSEPSSVQTTSPANSTTRAVPETPATMPRGEDNDVTHLEAWTQEHMTALPSPERVYQAQQIRFQHASLVPTPLRPRQGMASKGSEVKHATSRTESVQVDICRTPEGNFRLHPHPLRSHPVSFDTLAQEQIQQLEGSQKATADIRQRPLTTTDNRAMRAAVQSGLCRPDSTTLGVQQPGPYTSGTWYQARQERKSDGALEGPQDITKGRLRAGDQGRIMVGMAI
ncbi:hypothetical protein LTR67_005031 [Exophiala xenobiotica]